mmetsp:Transcript_154005/g.295317  ORF Transcript_154005/g.295317 Transcript_154005/m.295317 type:complete len:207 (+) Transcript_154005:1049-1669(+)
MCMTQLKIDCSQGTPQTICHATLAPRVNFGLPHLVLGLLELMSKQSCSLGHLLSQLSGSYVLFVGLLPRQTFLFHSVLCCDDHTTPAPHRRLDLQHAQFCIFRCFHCSILYLLQLRAQLRALLPQLPAHRLHLSAVALQLLADLQTKSLDRCLRQCTWRFPTSAYRPSSSHGLLRIVARFSEATPQLDTRIFLHGQLCPDSEPLFF